MYFENDLLAENTRLFIQNRLLSPVFLAVSSFFNINHQRRFPVDHKHILFIPLAIFIDKFKVKVK
jgi:hypothetical protein